MTTAPASLFHGRVTHRRLRPVGHAFVYRVFSMLIDLDRIDEATARFRFFSRNRFNLFSFFDRDHADEDATPIGARIRAMLWGAGFRGDGRIELLCYPRILGFVFNPLSVYYCLDAEGRLEAVLYEVRNTFGGMHAYLIPAEEEGGVIRQSADKAFRVSPFMDMDHRYHFRLKPPAGDVSVDIRLTDADGPIFYAAFAGERQAMSDAALVAAFFRYPLMTLKIVAAIHFEAARLFAKGLRLKKPGPDPAKPVSIVVKPPPRRDAA